MATLTSSKDFMSVDNFKTMMTVFKRFLLEKHSVDIDKTTIDLKRTLLDTMEKVYADLKDTSTTRDMNQITLKSIKNTVLKALAPADVTSMLSRDTALYGKRTTSSTHLLPEVTTLKNETGNKNPVVETFEQVRLARDTTPKVVPPPTGIEGVEIKPMQDAEFQAKLKALQEARASAAPSPNATTPIAKANGTANAYVTDDVGSVTESRNSLLVNIRENSLDFDRKSIYAPPPKLPLPPAASQEPDRLSIITTPEKEVPYVIQERYILSNSIDRDWLQQPYRYSYKVRFMNSTNETMNVPVYENNPTVPNTRTLTTSGIPNVAGFIYANTMYPAYDPAQSQGAVIGNESILIPIDVNANVQTQFRNIHSITVTNVIIPMDVALAQTPFGNLTGAVTQPAEKNLFNYDFNFNFPYVLLKIDEFSDMYEGTDDAILSTFCQLVFHKSYQSSVGRGYIVLRPAQGERKVFYPAALSVMPTLSISLLSPNGQLFNQSRDGLTIKKIDYANISSAAANFLTIVSNTWFDKNEYCQGDRVLIKGFSIFSLSTSDDQAAIQAFNQYINRVEGHEVIGVGDANPSGFYNSFYINAPATFDDASGALNKQTALTDALGTFNTNTVGQTFQNGFFLNMSLQNSVSFKLEQKVYDATVLGSTVV